MDQSRLNYSHWSAADNRAAPSAPPLGSTPAEEDVGAPPSYEEAIRAPGGSFSSASAAASADYAVHVDRTQLYTGSDGGGPMSHTVCIVPTAAGSAEAAATPVHPAQSSGEAGHGGADDPPSYQSLFGKIKDAKKSSSGICDFITAAFVMPLGCFLGLIAIVVLLGLVFCVPVTLLSVGSYYLHDCPLQPGVPIWMVAGGVVMLIYIFHSFSSKEESGCVTILACLFYIAWYIAGAILIYPVWQPRFGPREPYDTDYCDYTLFMTAFVIINLLSALTGVLCCVGCL